MPRGKALKNKEKPFLDRLNADDRAKVIAQLTRSKYARDEYVISRDKISTEVFVVLEGQARADSFSQEGRRVSYRDVGPGEIFGEVAGIDAGPRTADVIAVDSLVVGVMTAKVFRELIDSNADFRWTLLEHFAAQSRRMTDRIFEFSTMLVRDRLLNELIRQAEATGATEGRVELNPAPTHFDLATRISTHREAVSREMSKLSQRKLLSKYGGVLTIKDLDDLRAERDRSDVGG